MDQISEILIGLIFRYNNKGLPILKYFFAGFKVCFSGQRPLSKKFQVVDIWQQIATVPIQKLIWLKDFLQAQQKPLHFDTTVLQ